MNFDREIVYLMTIVIPINQETTRLYSVNDDMLVMGLESAVNHIGMVISKEGFITLERIFRILEMKASPNCPHILFDDFADYNYRDGSLELTLGYSFEATPFAVKNPKQAKVVNMRHISTKPRAKQEKTEDDIKEWSKTETQISSPKETSESEESDET